MRTTLVFVAVLSAFFVGVGCSTGRMVPRDAGTSDAHVVDGGLADAAPLDASLVDGAVRDAGPRDGGPRDGGPGDGGPRDAGRDSGPRDAGTDAPRDAASIDGGPLGSLIQCAPPIPPGATSGISFSPMFWSGFPFEITGGGAQVTRVGLQITPDGAGTIFGAIVRLTSASDRPDDPSIAGPDVVMRTLFAVPASGGVPVIAHGPLDVMLPPGWYAVVFGTGAFGATATGNIPSGGGAGCVSSPGSGYPFTIRQTDGEFILQGAQPHFFVEVAP